MKDPKNRYFRTARIIKDMPDFNDKTNFLTSFLRAPLFSVELDPIEAVKKLGLENLFQFFAFPFKSFLLDFASLGKMDPFIFCHEVDQNTFYLQGINLVEEIDPHEWVKNFCNAEDVGEKIAGLSIDEKIKIFQEMTKDEPIVLDRVIVRVAENEIGLIPSVYGNILCKHSHEKKKFYYQSHKDIISDIPELPPFFYTCPYIENGYGGCNGNLQNSCKQVFQTAQLLWQLVYATMIYANCPQTVLLGEAETLTQKEQNLSQKNKKPDAINPKKDRILILPTRKIVDLKHRVYAGGTHASPIPHLRKGHWRDLRSPMFKNKKGQKIWVVPASVGGDLEMKDGGVVYRVIELPTCKKRID